MAVENNKKNSTDRDGDKSKGMFCISRNSPPTNDNKVTRYVSNWRKGTALDVMMFFSGIEVKASPAHSTVALIDKDFNPWDLPELKDPAIPWSGGLNVPI